VLELVFDEAAARSTASGARSSLRTCRRRAAAELQCIGRFLFVFRNSPFALLQIFLQPLFFLEQVTQRILRRGCATLNRSADILAADSFSEALRHGRITIHDIEIDQTCA